MLNELTEEEKQALEAFPDCSVSHWMAGERLNFDLDRWESDDLMGTDSPEHYEFLRGSGFNGVTTEEVYRCERCKKTVKRGFSRGEK